MSKIIIVGDLFPTDNNVLCFEEGNINSLFGEKICQLFSDSVLTICNLEGALTNHTERCIKTGPIKVAPTNAISAYKKLGINCCMLANNHATDGGHQGLMDTMRTLDDAGIKYIGAGKNVNEIIRSFVQVVDGMNIGFYNVSETMYNKPTNDTAGAWLYDEYVVCNELKDLKKRSDYLIVIYHGGIEKFPYPSPEMRKRFYRMADSGADMILSQHTHCVGCEEWYNGSYLLYGQGDFLLKNYAPGLTDSGLIVELDVVEGKVEIKKHLVKSVDNLYVRYNEQQDLTAFEERSERVQDAEFVFEKFHDFCKEELKLYLTAYKSPGTFLRLYRKYFPKSFRKWLFSKAFSRRNLMFILHSLRSEQNRETAIVGIETLLEIDFVK